MRQRKRAPVKKGDGIICINKDSNRDGGKSSYKGGEIKQKWTPVVRVRNPQVKLLRALMEYHQQSDGQLELRLLM